MKISKISHCLFVPNKSRSQINLPNRLYGTLQDVFEYKIKEISRVTDVVRGDYGTQCRGSYPLRRFFKMFKTHAQQKELELLLKKGYSTNTEGEANCFLKDFVDVPLSTSGIYSCSVVYLFNKNNNKHFLYHVYHDFEPEKISKYITTFMPEKFTKACIVPGRNTFLYHYLPELFDTVKSIVPEAPVTVRHFTSPYPEVVGFRGDVFEIPNRKFLSDIKAGKHPLSGEGQATFKIRDLKSYVIFSRINHCKNVDDINFLRVFYLRKQKYKTILPELNRLLDEREANLKF